ncbi:MAG: hypothetical protein EAZ95_05400 [Bacteroidetes bacterium]|nr:MAG: hypothetical protein EAZ95_05400 [Bacteroidota bacterium]
MKKTKILSIFASLLVMMSAVVLYSCSETSNEVLPEKQQIKTSTDAQRTNSTGNLIIANETSKGIEFEFSQQQFQTAIVNAFAQANNVTVSADSTVYIVDEVNSQTSQTEYMLLLPITNANAERQYIVAEVVKEGTDYVLMGREVQCTSSDLQCPCSMNWIGRCRCSSGHGACSKIITRTSLIESFVSELE